MMRGVFLELWIHQSAPRRRRRALGRQNIRCCQSCEAWCRYVWCMCVGRGVWGVRRGAMASTFRLLLYTVSG